MKEEKKQLLSYTPTGEERDDLEHVQTRLTAMRIDRATYDKDWSYYWTMYEAIIKGYWDDRSKSTVPLLRAIVEYYKAEAIRMPTDFIIKAENSNNEDKAKLLDYVRKYDRRRNNRKKEFNEQEDVAAILWGSIMMVSYEKYDIYQKDPIINDLWKLSWQKKKIPISKILVKNIDPRDFYMDNNSIKWIEDSDDCILIQEVNYEEAVMVTKNSGYKNIEYVNPSTYQSTYQPFVTQEEIGKRGNFVQWIKYWCVSKDMYIEIMNNVVVKQHPIINTMNGIKALPFVVRPFAFKANSKWWVGFGEMCLLFNSEINDMRELLMDGVRRSNSPTIAIGKDLEFTGRKFSFNNEILTFNWNLANNFEQLAWTPPNQAIFAYLERIYKDIAMFVGIDIQSILWAPQQTAYQTNVQQESSLKRINVWLQTRDLAFERFADLYKDALQRFFPIKKEWKYPTIEIVDENYENGKFTDAEGEKQILDVKPEDLRWDVYIDVYTNTNVPASNIASKQSKLELAQALPAIVQGLQLAVQMGLEMDTKEFMEDLFENFDVTVDKPGPKGKLEQMDADFINNLGWILTGPAWMSWMWLPPPEQAQQQPNLQPNPAQVWASI